MNTHFSVLIKPNHSVYQHFYQLNNWVHHSEEPTPIFPQNSSRFGFDAVFSNELSYESYVKQVSDSLIIGRSHLIIIRSLNESYGKRIQHNIGKLIISNLFERLNISHSNDLCLGFSCFHYKDKELTPLTSTPKGLTKIFINEVKEYKNITKMIQTTFPLLENLYIIYKKNGKNKIICKASVLYISNQETELIEHINKSIESPTEDNECTYIFDDHSQAIEYLSIVDNSTNIKDCIALESISNLRQHILDIHNSISETKDIAHSPIISDPVTNTNEDKEAQEEINNVLDGQLLETSLHRLYKY